MIQVSFSDAENKSKQKTDYILQWRYIKQNKRKRSRSPSALKKLKKEKKKKHWSHSSDSSEVSVSDKKKSSHKKKKKKDKKKKEKYKQKTTSLDDEGRCVVKEEKDKSKEVAVPKSISVEAHNKRLAKS